MYNFDEMGSEELDEIDGAVEAIRERRLEDGLCLDCGADLAEKFSPKALEHCETCPIGECKESYPELDRSRMGGSLAFADPGGNSALRAAGPGNPRNLPCPNCGEPNRLTPQDKALGYQCDRCADRAERGGW